MSGWGPLFWLTAGQGTVVDAAIASHDKTLLLTVADEFARVPDCPDGVSATVYGELLTFLYLRGLEGDRHGQVGRVILSVVRRTDAPRIREDLERISAKAKDEDFSFDNGFFLHGNNPGVIRSGIAYLERGLVIPGGYDSLVVVLS
jgi:hypothetical protein